MRRAWRVLRWAFSGGGDLARHDELERRFPRALVLRGHSIPQVRDSIALYSPLFVPARDSRFSIVVDDRGMGLWAGERHPFRFVLLPWPSIHALGTRRFLDSRIRDLTFLDGGRRTTVLQVHAGDRVLELTIWGQEKYDHTTSLLDDYGLGRVIASLERMRPRATPSS